MYCLAPFSCYLLILFVYILGSCPSVVIDCVFDDLLTCVLFLHSCNMFYFVHFFLFLLAFLLIFLLKVLGIHLSYVLLHCICSMLFYFWLDSLFFYCLFAWFLSWLVICCFCIPFYHVLFFHSCHMLLLTCVCYSPLPN